MFSRCSWRWGGGGGAVQKTLSLTFTLSKENYNTVYLFLYEIQLNNVPFQVVIISTCCKSSKGQIALTSIRHHNTSVFFINVRYLTAAVQLKAKSHKTRWATLCPRHCFHTDDLLVTF